MSVCKKKQLGFISFLEDAEKEKVSILKQKADRLIAKQKAEVEKLAKNFQEGLPYAKKIFEWALGFRDNEIGKRVFALIETGYGENAKILVFWALEGQRFDWHHLSIRDDAVMGYYGTLPGDADRPRRHRAVDSPETLARWGEAECLKKAWESIENGQVYEKMEKMLKLALQDLKR